MSIVSAEPLLGPIDLREFLASVDRLTVGRESGRSFREMSLAAAYALVEQAHQAGIAAYVKQDSWLYAGWQRRTLTEWCSKGWSAPRGRGDEQQAAVMPERGELR